MFNFCDFFVFDSSNVQQEVGCLFGWKFFLRVKFREEKKEDRILIKFGIKSHDGEDKLF